MLLNSYGFTNEIDSASRILYEDSKRRSVRAFFVYIIWLES